MDEDFELFLEDFGPPIERRYVPLSSMERYKGRLPDQLLRYWEEYGWCGYANGLFWTVNPQDYEPALEAWIGNTSFMEQDAYHVIARSAFGKLYLWGERTGDSLSLFAPAALCFPRKSIFVGDKLNFGIRTFFSSQTWHTNDFYDTKEQPLFERAVQKLGRLKTDEMYGFTPALALGGPNRLENLQRVTAVEHLVLLAQLSELRVMTGPSI